MQTGNTITLEEMREKRKTSEVLFKKFTEARAYFDTHAFCFYEGEDGKYYNSRIAKHWGDKFITLVAGNKKEVLNIMRKITSDSLYSDVCTMFFIDRDFDESLANTNVNLFETPCYSIENLYAHESVFCNILHAEFGLTLIDSDYHKCLNDYNLRLDEFNQVIIKFNAIVKYKHKYAPDINCRFSNVKTSNLANITIEHVQKSDKHDSQISKLISQLNPDCDKLYELEQSFQEETELCSILRGKNQLDFMVSFIKELKTLNKNGGYFSKKYNNVHIELTQNRLSELSQYALTPPELEDFLKSHRTKAVS